MSTSSKVCYGFFIMQFVRVWLNITIQFTHTSMKDTVGANPPHTS